MFALIAAASADVSELRQYLPPPVPQQSFDVGFPAPAPTKEYLPPGTYKNPEIILIDKNVVS